MGNPSKDFYRWMSLSVDKSNLKQDLKKDLIEIEDKADLEEIPGSEEDTTVLDSLKRVQDLDLNKNTQIIYFNAHGRIFYKSGSDNLKKIVEKIDIPKNHNISFNLSFFRNNMKNMQDILNRNIFKNWYDDLILKFRSNTQAKKRKILLGIYDFEKLFNDEHGVFDYYMFDHFMKMMYILPNGQYKMSYDIFFRIISDKIDLSTIFFAKIA